MLKQKRRVSPSSSWESLITVLSCKSGSMCALRDVVHCSSRVVSRADEAEPSNSSAAGPEDLLASRRRQRRQPVAAPRGGAPPLMRLSSCYECRAAEAEPVSRRYPRPRSLCACPLCGEMFTKIESLDLHQTLRHAVSELGPEDSGRHIVEIIFKSSWDLKNQSAITTIDRILKVHNNPRTVGRFEDCRAAVKSMSGRRSPRCAADGNELLRFHPASLSCRLGSAGSTSLCISGTVPCGVCAVIRHGFRQTGHPLGVRTTAGSGLAHESFAGGGRRAMLVCRVIAGRVRLVAAGDDDVSSGSYDSIAHGAALEELFVANPRAILPCFVVVYTTARV